MLPTRPMLIQLMHRRSSGTLPCSVRCHHQHLLHRVRRQVAVDRLVPAERRGGSQLFRMLRRGGGLTSWMSRVQQRHKLKMSATHHKLQTSWLRAHDLGTVDQSRIDRHTAEIANELRAHEEQPINQGSIGTHATSCELTRKRLIII